MNARFGNLDTREEESGEYLLLADFDNLDEVLGKVTAKKGFRTNYASIDVLKNIMLFAFYALLVKYGDKSATSHDWLYTGYGVTKADGTVYYPTRKECDEFFYRSLLAEGVGKLRAKLFYWGVRVGGHKHCAPGPVLWQDGMLEA